MNPKSRFHQRRITAITAPSRRDSLFNVIKQELEALETPRSGPSAMACLPWKKNTPA